MSARRLFRCVVKITIAVWLAPTLVPSAARASHDARPAAPAKPARNDSSPRPKVSRGSANGESEREGAEIIGSQMKRKLLRPGRSTDTAFLVRVMKLDAHGHNGQPNPPE